MNRRTKQKTLRGLGHGYSLQEIAAYNKVGVSEVKKVRDQPLGTVVSELLLDFHLWIHNNLRPHDQRNHT